MVGVFVGEINLISDIRAKDLLSKRFNSTIKKGELLNSFEAMSLAIQEAYQGAFHASPNPLVGCVILDSQNRFLAKGFHEFCGGPHAEVNALHSLSEADLKGAHVFVTLEPCAHEGRTPSCAKMLAKLPIAKVTYGLKDPNPLVAGAGAAILAAAGKKAELYSSADLNEDLTLSLEELAENFLLNFRKKEVFIALKWAQSLDGKMALTNGHSKWITNSQSRKYAHYLRAIYDATMVGANTILQDDPQLNIRLQGVNKNNQIIIFDPNARVLRQQEQFQFSKIHDPGNVIFLIDEKLSSEDFCIKAANKIVFLNKESSLYNLSILNQKLFAIGIRSVLVEGGPKTLQYFLQQKQWHRSYAFIAPMILGQGLSYSSEINLVSMNEKLLLQHSKSMNLQNDILLTGKKEML